MLILINSNHEFVASYNDEDFQKVVDASQPGSYVAKSIADLIEFTGVELATLHNSLFPEKQIDRARNKEGCAEVIWKKAETFSTPRIIQKAIPQASKKSIVAADFPRISAILVALQAGGSKAELLHQSELNFSGKSEISHSIRAHFNMIFPAMVLAGVLIESEGKFEWAGGSCA